MFDADWDGGIGLDDFFLLADAFGTDARNFDADGDGVVDFDDFFRFLDFYLREQ